MSHLFFIGSIFIPLGKLNWILHNIECCDDFVQGFFSVHNSHISNYFEIHSKMSSNFSSAIWNTSLLSGILSGILSFEGTILIELLYLCSLIDDKHFQYIMHWHHEHVIHIEHIKNWNKWSKLPVEEKAPSCL